MSRLTTACVVVGLVIAMVSLGGAAVMSAGIALTLVMFFVGAFVTSLVTLTLALRAHQKRQAPQYHTTTDVSLSAGAQTLSD